MAGGQPPIQRCCIGLVSFPPEGTRFPVFGRVAQAKRTVSLSPPGHTLREPPESVVTCAATAHTDFDCTPYLGLAVEAPARMRTRAGWAKWADGKQAVQPLAPNRGPSHLAA